jgi:hypothetical protein
MRGRGAVSTRSYVVLAVGCYREAIKGGFPATWRKPTQLCNDENNQERESFIQDANACTIAAVDRCLYTLTE